MKVMGIRVIFWTKKIHISVFLMLFYLNFEVSFFLIVFFFNISFSLVIWLTRFRKIHAFILIIVLLGELIGRCLDSIILLILVFFKQSIFVAAVLEDLSIYFWRELCLKSSVIWWEVLIWDLPNKNTVTKVLHRSFLTLDLLRLGCCCYINYSQTVFE